ncbi:MAG: aminotransferase class IV [Pyrinomonadaceae bacterium]
MPDANLSAATLYGKGVFTTAAIKDGRPVLWEKHWHRIASHAAALDIDLSGHNESSTLEALIEAVSNAGLINGRARVAFSDESPSRIWSHEKPETRTALSIIVAERRPIPANFELTVSPHRINTTSPLVGIKSCNYLDHLLAWEEASNRGFHEAIRLNERGEIASACMANVFWEKGGKLFTPSLATGCLPGTTREYILENIECEEVAVGIEELTEAARIFLTSAGIGVVKVAEAGGRDLDTSDHPISGLLPF